LAASKIAYLGAVSRVPAAEDTIVKLSTSICSLKRRSPLLAPLA
jgi:hypothetical protein